jgi:hypothetical protein
MSAKTPQPKPGYKTTQFYSTTGGAAALLETARQMDNPWVQGACILAAGVVLALYTWSRTSAYGGAA